MLILDSSEETKLRRIYVALAMSREAALHINKKDEASQSAVLFLNVASEILEEILDSPAPSEIEEAPTFELLM